MLHSTWCVMASPLLLVPSTFLTAISLSNFYSLNPCLAIALLSINIPVVPLSKSALTIMPSCISIFFTSMFNHTSLNILKVLLTSFRLPPSLAALLPLWAVLPSPSFFPCIHTRTFYPGVLPGPCYLLHNSLSFHILYTHCRLLLFLGCTTLILVTVLPLALLCHNAPLLSSLAPLSSSPSILGVLFPLPGMSPLLASAIVNTFYICVPLSHT